ncbi:MAG TPA: alanine--tRNA ligase, partial [Ktedonobacterales bacterium]|nr:alanine--tRNA ligase [Ktedonobacterales bacterium]
MPAKRSRPGSSERPGTPNDQTDDFSQLTTRLTASIAEAASTATFATRAAKAAKATARHAKVDRAAHTAATDDARTASATAQTSRAAKVGQTAQSGKATGQTGKARTSRVSRSSNGAWGGVTPSLTGAEIRERFLSFFERQGHLRMPSSSLVSRDPTVLFTVAGMQQMIPFFLGQEQPPGKRLTTAQKVYRTIDIDEVGDSSHLTFFEMLGNFSVGDYFKREAITFAWELLTQGYGIPAGRLFPTVHPDDDEAPGLWQEIAGIPDAEITRLSDNWWGPPGDRGPCGPDSEIYFDRGAEYGCGRADCAPGCEHCDRYLEIWNLVFMQYYQDADGQRMPLKQPNIDTGMGLERLASVLQGKESVYDTDLFRTIIDAVARLSGVAYGENPAHDRALRVIADHGRGLTFLAGDGVLPGNSGRSYVFRRVLRRAALFGRRLGLEGAFLGDVANAVIDLMGSHYIELVARRDQIVEVLTLEERRFNKTLTTGLQLLTRELDELARTEKREVPGRLAFRLYDTHGFPLELTEEIAQERGMTVDRAGYDSAMLEQRGRAREQKPFVREREEEAWTQLSKGLPAT